MINRHPSFCLVGPGRVGSSLGIALVKEGWRCVAIVRNGAASHDSRRLKKVFPGASLVNSPSSLCGDFELLLLTVSDNALENTAIQLSENPRLKWRGKVVLHASGIVPVSAIKSLKAAGASTGAFHPISAFATKFLPAQARNIYYDFFGGKPARKMAFELAAALSSKVLSLRSERERELLHIASVIVSNFTVIGMRAATELTSGITRGKDAGNLFEGLLNSTIANLQLKRGMSSLTGPLARGDLEVITKHLEALESNPVLLQFYKSSSLLGVDMLVRNARTPARRRELLKMRRLLLPEG